MNCIQLSFIHSIWLKDRRNRMMVNNEWPTSRKFIGPRVRYPRSGRVTKQSTKVELVLQPHDRDFMEAYWDWCHVELKGEFAIIKRNALSDFHRPMMAYALESDALMAKMRWGTEE